MILNVTILRLRKPKMTLPSANGGNQGQVHEHHINMTDTEKDSLNRLLDKLPNDTRGIALRGVIEDMNQCYMVKKTIVENALLKCANYSSVGTPTGTLVVIQDPRAQQIDQISAVSTLSVNGNSDNSTTRFDHQRFHQILYRPRKFIRAIDRVPGSDYYNLVCKFHGVGSLPDILYSKEVANFEKKNNERRRSMASHFRNVYLSK
jgi:hypothetical protein